MFQKSRLIPNLPIFIYLEPPKTPLQRNFKTLATLIEIYPIFLFNDKFETQNSFQKTKGEYLGSKVPFCTKGFTYLTNVLHSSISIEVSWMQGHKVDLEGKKGK